MLLPKKPMVSVRWSKRVLISAVRFCLILTPLFATLLIFGAKYWQGMSAANNKQCPVKRVAECSRYEPPPEWQFPFTGTDDVLDLSRVLLVIHFNSPEVYSSGHWAHSLYHEIFADIIFCGPAVEDSREKPKGAKFVSYSDWRKHDTAFRDIVAQQGENFYACIDSALSSYHLLSEDQAYDQFDGILAMSDDVLLNFWQLKADGFKTSQNWLMAPDPPYVFDIKSGNFCDRNGCWYRGEDYWMWPAIYHLSLFAFDEEFITRDEWIDFELRLANITFGQRHRLLGRTSADCFYIARDHLREAIQMFRLFNKYRVYMEIAVPTTLYLISSGQPNALKIINTSSHYWATNDPKRPTAPEIYRADLQLVHPFKMAKLFTDFDDPPGGNCLYCALKDLADTYAIIQKLSIGY